MDGQDSLENSTGKLAIRIQRYHKELVQAEDRATKAQPMSIDTVAFAQLRRRASLMAIEKLRVEWIALQKEIKDIEQHTGDCDCNIRLRYSLPCKHELLLCLLEEVPIPLSLLHPRWYIRGPPAPANWGPLYDTATKKPLIILLKKSAIEQKLQVIDYLRNRVLQGDDARSYQAYIEHELDTLIRYGRNTNDFARLPQLLLETLQKHSQKTKKGTQKSRELTAREGQDRQRRKEKRVTQKSKRKEAIINRRQEDHSELPPSTAPPRLISATAFHSPPVQPPRAPHSPPVQPSTAPHSPPVQPSTAPHSPSPQPSGSDDDMVVVGDSGDEDETASDNEPALLPAPRAQVAQLRSSPPPAEPSSDEIQSSTMGWTGRIKRARAALGYYKARNDGNSQLARSLQHGGELRSKISGRSI
jgi:hypothetical protein